MRKMSAILMFTLIILGTPVPDCVLADDEQNSKIQIKLEQILDNQKEILKQLSELKDNIEVVKIRATR